MAKMGYNEVVGLHYLAKILATECIFFRSNFIFKVMSKFSKKNSTRTLIFVKSFSISIIKRSHKSPHYQIEKTFIHKLTMGPGCLSSIPKKNHFSSITLLNKIYQVCLSLRYVHSVKLLALRRTQYL